MDATVSSLTKFRESQLFASNSRIHVSPEVIAHCPPVFVDAHFHTTFVLVVTSHESDVSSVACCRVYTSHVTCEMSWDTLHMEYKSCDMSHVEYKSCHMSHVDY